jgi:hypothetical protein
MPASEQMKSIFLACPLRLLRMHASGHSVRSIVDAGSNAMAAVAFYGRAAAGESREENEAAEDEDNISHVEFLDYL